MDITQLLTINLLIYELMPNGSLDSFLHGMFFNIVSKPSFIFWFSATISELRYFGTVFLSDDHLQDHLEVKMIP
jgi:hypothetical protein